MRAWALPLLSHNNSDDDTFLVLNGDVFTDYDFQDNRHLSDGVLAHLLLVPNQSITLKEILL